MTVTVKLFEKIQRKQSSRKQFKKYLFKWGLYNWQTAGIVVYCFKNSKYLAVYDTGR